MTGRMSPTLASSNTPGSSAIILRLVVLAAGWTSLLLAVPTPVYRYAAVLVVATGVLAAAATVVPHRHVALVFELVTVALWLLPGGHPGPTAVAAVLLAAALYVHHAAAALAAATGWDVRTTRSLTRQWSMRTASTVLGASLISVVMLALTSLGTASLPDAALLVGLAAAVLAVAVPLVALRRRPIGVSESSGPPLD